MSGAPSPITRDDLRAVIAACADGMVVVDHLGTICYANPAAGELFGRDPEELRGRTFGYPLEAGGVTDIGVFRRGQPLTVEMCVTALRWEGEPAFLAALRDVTERKQAEEILRSAVRLRDDVVSMVAHDLRTPLTAISGYTEVLLADEGLQDEHREIVGRIRKQAERLARFSESLLTLSRLDGGHLDVDTRPVDVVEVIRRVVADLPHHLERRIGEVDVNIDAPADLVALADPDHLGQILTNYLVNAARYGAPPVEVHARRAGEVVEIRVADHGDGVPEDFRPHLFDRFRRGGGASRTAEGAGLGLTVVRRLAEACGGAVWYEPNRTKGACFGLRLPAAPGGRTG